MKKIKICFVVLFFAILIIPVITFNFNENAISEIDNKVLAENPFEAANGGEDLTDSIESYVAERIGFRNQMILSYIVANDVMFNEMVHPSYMYGKEGYIFSKANALKTYGEFEEAFVRMLCEMQKYYTDRGITFVFVFEPSKTSILRDKLPDGYMYNNDWVEEFIQKLDEMGINYVDNSDTMSLCYANGIEVFNVKYNAGHWNDRGAFYGMNEVLKNLSDRGVKVHINDASEYTITNKLNTTLPVSEFPIYEYEPIYNLNSSEDILNITEEYADEINRDTNFRHFAYFVNEKRLSEGAPRTLVFQGSYINGMGYKFLQNALGEYIAVHDYQNVLDFEYYINIFQPECVIFDAAEYTFSNKYFDLKTMQTIVPTPLLNNFSSYTIKLATGNVEIHEKNCTTTITVSDVSVNGDFAYFLDGGREYDMKKIYYADNAEGSTTYTVTVDNSRYDGKNSKIVIVDESNQIQYQITY